MLINTTIAAIATAVSNAGIGIIRICGTDAFSIIDKIYKSKNKKKILSLEKTHTIHHGYIYDGEEIIDEVLVSIMHGPRSYTGENTVEINCHGGSYVLKKVLETVIDAGAIPAEPGEFTKRAFLNGKLDLSQAEAVMDLIESQNEYALKSSINQLRGSIHEVILNLRKAILFETAFIETALDDPEHISIDGYAEKLKYKIVELIEQLEVILRESDNGRILQEGVQTVILGKPNAGKSSLLNALTGLDKAIVTNIEGTTRDVLEEKIQLGGVTLNIVDTAGIRDTEDVVEKIGVNKAKEYAKEADLIIYVIDSSRELDENDTIIQDIIKDKKAIILFNKVDLDIKVNEEHLKEFTLKYNIPFIKISTLNNIGMKELEEKIVELFVTGKIDYNNQVYITNVRQKNDIKVAKNSLEKVLYSIESGMPEDFYSIDLLDAYDALGKIIGETIGEDLVNEIFSKFCMGK